MKLIWTDFASETLKDICKYYKEAAGEGVAKKIKKGIFSATKQLLRNPNLGQIETTLKKLGEGHRYLVSGNYKIIYREVSEGILITDVFDTRQDPDKINNPGRKPNR